MSCKQSRFILIILYAFMAFTVVPAGAQNPTGRDVPKPKKSAVKKASAKKPTRKTASAHPTATSKAVESADLTVIAPPGALIELDGKNQGLIGAQGQLVLTSILPGKHQLSVRAEGYQSWNGTVTVQLPATSFEVPLIKKAVTGRFTVYSNEPGTEVFLDGKSFGITGFAGEPLPIEELKAGRYELRAVKEGFKPWRGTQDLTAGETVTIKIELQPILDPEMIRIPAGDFTMGNNRGPRDARPAHPVFVDEFEISRSEITNRLYKYFIDATGHPAPSGVDVPAPYRWEGNNYPIAQADQPVVLVSWEDAVAFCRWLSEQTGKRYRLPTEAEWEKAARSASSQYSSAGNVWEWCFDWYDPDYYNRSERINPTGPPRGKKVKLGGLEGEMRVIRGGTFGRASLPLSAADRNAYPPKQGRFDIGFRVVRDFSKN